jgi:hypothetical protein
MNRDQLFGPQLYLLKFVGWKFEYSESWREVIFKLFPIIWIINGIFNFLIECYFIAFSAKSLEEFTEAIAPPLSTWECILKVSTLCFFRKDLDDLMLDLKKLLTQGGFLNS